MKIVERDRLSKEDILLIQLSVILHDIGNGVVGKDHAKKGVEIVKVWLDKGFIVQLELELDGSDGLYNEYKNSII